jgi:hypothetical protein
MTQFIFAYLGPETILPMTSVLAAAIGVLLVCWRFVARLVMRPVRHLLGIKDPAADVAATTAEAAPVAAAPTANPEAQS